MPMWIGLKSLVRIEDRAASIISTLKDMCKSTGELISDLPECELLVRTGGTFYQQANSLQNMQSVTNCKISRQ
jgi:hypothetical protein